MWNWYSWIALYLRHFCSFLSIKRRICRWTKTLVDSTIIRRHFWYSFADVSSLLLGSQGRYPILYTSYISVSKYAIYLSFLLCNSIKKKIFKTWKCGVYPRFFLRHCTCCMYSRTRRHKLCAYKSYFDLLATVWEQLSFGRLGWFGMAYWIKEWNRIINRIIKYFNHEMLKDFSLNIIWVCLFVCSFVRTY